MQLWKGMLTTTALETGRFREIAVDWSLYQPVAFLLHRLNYRILHMPTRASCPAFSLHKVLWFPRATISNRYAVFYFSDWVGYLLEFSDLLQALHNFPVSWLVFVPGTNFVGWYTRLGLEQPYLGTHMYLSMRWGQSNALMGFHSYQWTKTRSQLWQAQNIGI